MTVNVPTVVEMKVIAAAQVLCDISGNAQKPGKLETGITLMVPLFIKEGDTVRVRTEDKSYHGRT